MSISSIQAGLYHIPLPVTLSDSTHGDMTNFELITVRLKADSGEEGVGFTYTTGIGGAAIVSLIERELTPVLLGSEEERIEQLWEKMWWRLHYVGRGGLAAFAISTIDIALSHQLHTRLFRHWNLRLVIVFQDALPVLFLRNRTSMVH